MLLTGHDKILVEDYEMTKEAVLLLESKRLDESFVEAYRQAKALDLAESPRLKAYSHNSDAKVD
jgi:hypothetical protein